MFHHRCVVCLLLRERAGAGDGTGAGHPFKMRFYDGQATSWNCLKFETNSPVRQQRPVGGGADGEEVDAVALFLSFSLGFLPFQCEIWVGAESIRFVL